MLIDLLRKRRSIRAYQDKPVEQEKVDLLIEAMLRSPSSRGLNPWHFVVVRDGDTLAALAQAKEHGSAFMKGASLAIVVCADPERSDVWVEDCSIASILLHLQATDLGLGSCWIQIRRREHDGKQSAEAYISDLLELKEDMVVEAVIAIGYPLKETAGHPASSLPRDKVSYERYGRKA